MDPVSLTVAITGGLIAIGGTAVALFRKQKSEVNARSETEALDSVVYEHTHPTITYETRTDGVVIKTVTGGSTKLTIHERDEIHNNTAANNTSNGYTRNTVPVRVPTVNTPNNENGSSNNTSDSQSAPNAQDQTTSNDQDRPIENIDISEIASLQDGNILSIRGYTKGDIKIDALYLKTTESKNSAAYTHLVQEFQSQILPQIMQEIAGNQILQNIDESTA